MVDKPGCATGPVALHGLRAQRRALRALRVAASPASRPSTSPPPRRSGSLRQIGEVANLVGLSLRTVRHYEDSGLVLPAARTPGRVPPLRRAGRSTASASS